jgi:hypothetical protein
MAMMKPTSCANNLYDPGLHLFVDHSEVHQLWGVEPRLVQLRKHPEPVLVADQPWEAGKRVQTWGSVLRNPSTGLLEMYYLVFDATPPEPGHLCKSFMCLALSRDGIHWEKPTLGVYEFEGSRENNIIFMFVPPHDDLYNNLDGVSILRDETEPDPQRRYKLFAFMHDVRMWPKAGEFGDSTPEEALRKYAPWGIQSHMPPTPPHPSRELLKAQEMWGLNYVASADSMHWQMPPVMIANRYGDRMNVSRDYRTGEWVIITKARQMGPQGTAPYIRGVAVTRSLDLIHWSEWERLLLLDEPDGYGLTQEHHGAYVFNYGSGYLGWVEVMQRSNGLVDERIISSDDGRHWTRIDWERPFLPHGEAGEWDDQWVVFATNPPIVMGDELFLYYCAFRGSGHPSDAIGLARMRLDGFVGLWAGRINRWGGPENKPFVTSQMVDVTGPHLKLNFHAVGNSGLRVQLMDNDMLPIPGYKLDECLPLEEDGVRSEVRWRDHADVSQLVGQRVRVHIQWEAGVLYSYRFGG